LTGNLIVIPFIPVGATVESRGGGFAFDFAVFQNTKGVPRIENSPDPKLLPKLL
jgi:hypothetical protein